MGSSTDRRSFGALLKQQRLAAGLTQAALGERAGIAERTIQDLERDVARPRRETIQRLIDALELAPADRAVFEAVSPSPRQRSGAGDAGVRPVRRHRTAARGACRCAHGIARS